VSGAFEEDKIKEMILYEQKIYDQKLWRNELKKTTGIFKIAMTTPHPPSLQCNPFAPPPPFGENLAYICVTNNEDGVGEYLYLPLNADCTLSMSTLNKAFPEATGLYYYAFFGKLGIIFCVEYHKMKKGFSLQALEKKLCTLSKGNCSISVV